jgi:hypothetical protein
VRPGVPRASVGRWIGLLGLLGSLGSLGLECTKSQMTKKIPIINDQCSKFGDWLLVLGIHL